MRLRLSSWWTCVEGNGFECDVEEAVNKGSVRLDKEGVQPVLQTHEHGLTKHNCFVSKFFLSEDRLFRTAQAWVLVARLI